MAGRFCVDDAKSELVTESLMLRFAPECSTILVEIWITPSEGHRMILVVSDSRCSLTANHRLKKVTYTPSPSSQTL